MKSPKIFTTKELIIFFVSILFIVSAFIISVLYFFHTSLNRQAISFLKKQDIKNAKEYFLKEVEQNPENPYSHLNLAFLYNINKKPLRALKKYEFLENHLLKSVRFFSHFNQAEISAHLGNIDEALLHYQASLPMAENEEAQKVRENIEFLLSEKKNNSNSKKNDKEDSKKNNEKEDSKENSKDEKEDSDSEQKKEGKSDQKEENKPNEKNKNEEKDSESNENQDSDNDPNENPESSNDNKENRDSNKEKSENSTSEDSKENSEAKDATASESKKTLNEKEKQIILNEIEKQESKIRAKQFQTKPFKEDLKKKDW